MKPIHKFNNGMGATLCNGCYVILKVDFTKDLFCEDCNKLYNELQLQFDSDHRCLEALRDIKNKELDKL